MTNELLKTIFNSGLSTEDKQTISGEIEGLEKENAELTERLEKAEITLFVTVKNRILEQ